MKLTFGEYLRQLRLKANYGLRSFATAIEMQPSNLCNIEYGRTAPPQGEETLKLIATTLGLEPGSKEWKKLFDLAVKHKDGALPADVVKYGGTTPGIPVLLRTIENKKLSKKELEELTDYVNRRYSKS
ncbi:MAG: helix-turn-helix transcriptional regulator [Planctomycetes bacterium]|nr:helix-turn-helix transcriptional regulator [Planctomycetota bacterium]